MVGDIKTTWNVPRDPGPADYGSFATFLGELATSAVGPTAYTGAGSTGTCAAKYMYGSEPQLFATIRSTVEHRGVKRKCETKADDAHTAEDDEQGDETFWTDERAEEAWDYLRDVVYGGVDGYAYVRSLAEFCAPSVYLDDVRKVEGEDADGDVDEKQEKDDTVLPLGVPIARYVEDNLVDMVTRGRHGRLRDVLLPTTMTAIDPAFASRCRDGTTSPFCLRSATLPDAARTMASFQERYQEKLDVAPLIRVPEELAVEGMLEGGPVEGGEHAEIERALAWSAEVFEELVKRVKRDGLGKNDGRDGNVKVEVKEETQEDARAAEETEEAADTMDVDAKSKAETDEDDPNRSNSQPKLELDTNEEEDPLMKRLRLNLLALAKRAPVNKIAKVPAELVPERIRGIVPTAE